MKINIEDFVGKCSCGKYHQLATNEIILEERALQKIPEYLQKKPYLKDYRRFVMICDDNTYEAAGKQVETFIDGVQIICLNSENLHADEVGVEKVNEQLKTMKEPDCFIAVGSGTIHDLTRYSAYQKGIPFISIPTAASVDGYVSTVAAMSWYGFKKSMIAVSPILVIADSNILADAPLRLTASGVGDLLGKYTALADWKITNALNGEYICEKICEMEYEALNNLKRSLKGLKERDIKAHEELMYGLLLSGLAMQMTGHSRPASGAEHHIAHFWEMAVVNKELDAYHGEKVGVALLLVSDIYHKAVQYLEKGNFTVKKSVDIENGLIEKVFQKKELCESIRKINNPNLLNSINPIVLKEKTEDIVKIIKAIPRPEEIKEMLDETQSVSTLEEIGLKSNIKKITAEVAPYIRDRITFLRILKFYDFYKKII